MNTSEKYSTSETENNKINEVRKSNPHIRAQAVMPILINDEMIEEQEEELEAELPEKTKVLLVKLQAQEPKTGISELELKLIDELLKKHIPKATHKYKFNSYPKSFTGAELVEFLKSKSEYVKCDESAIEVANILIKRGTIVHIERDYKELKNDKTTYYMLLSDKKDQGHVPTQPGTSNNWKEGFKGLEHKILNADLINQTQLQSQTDFGQKNDTHIQEILVDEHNAELLDCVRPIRWQDPEPEPMYNMVAIGAGAGGLVTALGVAGVGGKSAICEKNLFGGDCLNTGCVPSKALISAAKHVHNVRQGSKYGITCAGEFKVDFQKVMESIRKKRATIGHHDACDRFIKDYGIDIFLGHAKFIDQNTIECNGKKLKFARAVIASGGRPYVPIIPGIENVYYYTSENIFNIVTRPQNIVIIGGGPIGAELGQSFQRLGCKVTFLLKSSRFLNKEDPDAAKIVKNKLEKEGCTFYTNVKYNMIESSNDLSSSPPNIQKSSRCVIHLLRTTESHNKTLSIHCDILILACGRLPNVNGMNLEAAGVKFDEKRGIHIGETMRTSNSKIYAVGDCCQSQHFTHMADQMARTVIKNACFFGSGKYTEMVIPRVTYTDPELAQVGLNKIELAEQGIEFSEYIYDFKESDRAICDDDLQGFIKFYTVKNTPTILGCVIVCARAGEMIGEAALAMSNKLTLSHIYNTVHPYPTYSESFRAAAGKWANTKLTTNAKVMLRKLLKFRA